MKTLNKKQADFLKAQGADPEEFYFDEATNKLKAYPEGMGGWGSTFGRQAALGAAPTVIGGIAATKAGAIGAAAGTATGPAAPVASPVLALGAGITAGVGAAMAQDAILQSQFPNFMERASFDRMRNPTAWALGNIATGGLVQKQGLLLTKGVLSEIGRKVGIKSLAPASTVATREVAKGVIKKAAMSGTVEAAVTGAVQTGLNRARDGEWSAPDLMDLGVGFVSGAVFSGDRRRTPMEFLKDSRAATAMSPLRTPAASTSPLIGADEAARALATNAETQTSPVKAAVAAAKKHFGAGATAADVQALSGFHPALMDSEAAKMARDPARSRAADLASQSDDYTVDQVSGFMLGVDNGLKVGSLVGKLVRKAKTRVPTITPDEMTAVINSPDFESALKALENLESVRTREASAVTGQVRSRSETEQKNWDTYRELGQGALKTPEGAERTLIMEALPSKMRKLVGTVANTPEEVADLASGRIKPHEMVAAKAAELEAKGIDGDALLKNDDAALANTLWNTAITKDPAGLYAVLQQQGYASPRLQLALEAGFVTKPEDLQGILTYGLDKWLAHQLKKHMIGTVADAENPDIVDRLKAVIASGKDGDSKEAAALADIQANHDSKMRIVDAQLAAKMAELEKRLAFAAELRAKREAARTPKEKAEVAKEETTATAEAAKVQEELVALEVEKSAPKPSTVGNMVVEKKKAEHEYKGYQVVEHENGATVFDPTTGKDSLQPTVQEAHKIIDGLIAAQSTAPQRTKIKVGDKVSVDGTVVTVTEVNSLGGLTGTLPDKKEWTGHSRRVQPVDATTPLSGKRPGDLTIPPEGDYTFRKNAQTAIEVMKGDQVVGIHPTVQQARNWAKGEAKKVALEEARPKAVVSKLTISPGSTVRLKTGKVLTAARTVGGKVYGTDETGSKIMVERTDVEAVVPLSKGVPVESPVEPGDVIITKDGKRARLDSVDAETNLAAGTDSDGRSVVTTTDQLNPLDPPVALDHIGFLLDAEGALDIAVNMVTRKLKKPELKELAKRLRISENTVNKIHDRVDTLRLAWLTAIQREGNVIPAWPDYLRENLKNNSAEILKYGRLVTGRDNPATIPIKGKGMKMPKPKGGEAAFLNVDILADAIGREALESFGALAKRAAVRLKQIGGNPVELFYAGVKDLDHAVRDLGMAGRYVGNKMAMALRDRQYYENQFTFRVQDISDSLTPAERTNVNNAFSEVFNVRDESASPIFNSLSPAELKAYEDLRGLYRWAHVTQTEDGPFVTDIVNGVQIQRPPITIDSWYPNHLATGVSERMRTQVNSAERQLWQQWLVDRGGMSTVQANEIITRVLGTTNGSPNSDFKPLRMAEGLGLPPELRADVFEATTMYGRRWAGDMAYFRNIEQDPKAAWALGLDDDGRGNKIQPAFWDDAQTIPVENSLREMSSVQLLMQSYSRRKSDFGRKYGAMYQALSSAAVSTISAVRDVVRSPGIIMAMAEPSDYGQVINSFFKHSRKAAREGGAYPARLTSTAGFDAEVSGTLTKFLTQMSAKFNRMSGADFVNEFGASWAYDFGAVMANKRYGQEDFMRRFAPDGWADMDPEYVKRHIAQEMSQSVRGSYNAAELPARLLDETGGAWRYMIGFGRWSVGRFNRWKRHVYDEAYQHGNFKPLLGQLLGVVGSNAVMDLIQDNITKSKPPEMSLKEWAGSDFERTLPTLIHELASSGSMGMLADLAYMTTLMAEGNVSQLMGYENPVTGLIQDLTIKSTYLSQAIHDGTPWPLAIKEYAKDVAATKIQWAAQLRRWDQDDPGRRLRRMYLRDIGKVNEDGEIVKGNPPALSYNPYSARNILGRTEDEGVMAEVAPFVNPNARFKDAVQDDDFYNYVGRLQGPEKARTVLRADEGREALNQKRKAYLNWAQSAL